MINYLLKLFNDNLDKIALINDGYEFTYKDIIDIYNNLDQTIDVPNNSVVSIHADFSIKSIATLMVLIQRNCIIVPFSTNVKNIDTLLNISQAEYSIVDNEVCNNNVFAKHEIYTILRNRNHAGLVLFSSGTTGMPKAAVHDLKPLLAKFKTQSKIFRTITFLLFDHIGGFNTLFYCLSSLCPIIVINERTSDCICKTIEPAS